MKKTLLSIISISLILISACKKDAGGPNNSIDIPEGYSLIWNDEFDEPTINTTNWGYETGDGTDYGLPTGWGNNEKQIYTNSTENSGIETYDEISVFTITALEDNSGGYTSAKLTTKEHITARFGRIEVKAKMPEGQGLWPAIWMLGSNIDLISWPGCGEIDIAEVLGHQTSTLNSTLHYTNDEHKHGEIQNIHELSAGNFNDEYHIFALDWTPESLTFILDGQTLKQIQIEDDMKEFLRSFYMILNVAVGGNLPGDPNETTVFPQSMYIDYVRIFSKNDFQAPAAPELDIEEETVGQIIEPNIGDNAIRDEFTELGSLTVITYGPGEPQISSSDTAINGDLSLVFNFPGGNWGGAYIELETPVDLSTYTYLKFSLNKPTSLANAEIKLESPSTNVSIFLENYTGVLVDEGFIEYSIPLSDFTDLDVTEIKIPFAIWNPQNANAEFLPAKILIDNVYFSN